MSALGNRCLDDHTTPGDKSTAAPTAGVIKTKKQHSAWAAHTYHYFSGLNKIPTVGKKGSTPFHDNVLQVATAHHNRQPS